MSDNVKVLFDHDGGIDDYLALLLLVSYQDELEVLGVSVTPADCYPEAAVPATRKILDLGGLSSVQESEGSLSGQNAFPDSYRVDSYRVDAMPILNRDSAPTAPLSELPGHEFIVDLLRASTDPVTVVMTGPLTNLAWALDHHPEVEDQIAELVLMGGALDIPGNVKDDGHDGSAEWNIYWDPAAAQRVWQSEIPITLFPLDATNQVPVTRDFLYSFGRQYGFDLSAAAGCIWALTAAYRYYCWDTLTMSYLGRPDICSFREVESLVVPEGPSQGRTVVSTEGRPLKAAKTVDTEAFYRHCLESLAR